MGRVTTDRSVCISAGNCVLAAPEWFVQDDEEAKVVFLENGEMTAADDERVQEAADVCPVGAIAVESDS